MASRIGVCPECDEVIGKAKACKNCGWGIRGRKESSNATSYPVFACAHTDCGIDAQCRIQTKTGWTWLCWRHYDAYFSQQAIDNLDKYGMELQPDETKAEHVLRMRLFVREGIRRMAKSGGRQAALDAMAAVQARQP